MNDEDLAERVRLHYRTTDRPLLLAESGIAPSRRPQGPQRCAGGVRFG